MNKYYIKVILVVVTLIFTIKVNAEDIYTTVTKIGDFTISKNGTLTVHSGGVLTITGSLFDDKGLLNVMPGGKLIVYGNMTLTNTQSKLDGNIIVLGNVSLKNTDMIGSANLIVGGTLSADGSVGNIDGDVYLLDPEVNPNPPSLGNNPSSPPSDLDDLIGSEEDSGLIDDILDITGSTSYVWDGSESSDWKTTLNWSGNKVPGALDIVVIDRVITLPKCPAVLTLQDLIIKPGASLTIAEGSQITILGDLTIESDESYGSGRLIVQNSNALPTSFLVYGQVSGDITFRWTLGALNYWFIGHPISNPSMSVYREINNDPDNRCVLFDYSNTGTLVNRVADAGFEFPAGDELRGYQLKMLNTTTVEQTGEINTNPTYSKEVIPNGGWQIIANPYPAYYKLPVDNGDFDATEGTVYVTTGTSNASKMYYTFNTLSGLDSPANSAGEVSGGIIAPGQAFYIKSKADALGSEKIYMKAQHLVHAPTVTLKSSGEKKEENVLRIKLKNESGLTDEAVIALFPNGSFEQTRLDSEQLFYNKTDYSYIFSQENNTKSVIKVLPERIWGHEQKLGIKAKAGRQLLSISGIDNLTESYELVLYDRIANVSTIMDSETVYEFDLREDVEEDRFVLQFNQPQDQIATDVDEIEVNGGVDIFVQTTNYLNVVCNWEAINKIVRVYSLTGSELFNQSFTASRFGTQLNLPSGVYIVKVTSGIAHFEKKIVVK